MNVSLTKHFEEFVEHLVETGRFANNSEVIRAALRLLEDDVAARESRLESLRAQVAAGLDDLETGRYTTVRNEAELDDFFEDIKSEGRAASADRPTE